VTPPFLLRFGSLDLAPYLRIGNDDGFDPYDSSGLEEPAFIDNPFGEGQGLANVDSRNREMSWPLYLHNTAAAAVTNLVPNPSAEIDETGWSFTAAGGWTSTAFQRRTEWSASGSASLRLFGTKDADTLTETLEMVTPAGTSGMPVSALTTYTAQCELNVTNAPVLGMRLAFSFYDAAGAFLSSAASALQWPNQVVEDRMVASFTPPASTAFLRLHIQAISNSALDFVQFYADSIMVEEGSSAGTYGDGSFPGWSWSGVAHNSSSAIAAGKDGLHAIVRDINNEIRYAARPLRVEWRDQDASDSTFYDVEFARFDPNFKMRPSAQKWLAGTLRVWCKPYGHTATYRVVGTSGAATSQVGTYPVPSMAGDVDALLMVTAGASRGAANTPPLYTVVSVLPTPDWVPWWPAASLVAGGSLAGASGFIGSQARVHSIPPTGSTPIDLLYLTIGPSAYPEPLRVIAILDDGSTGATRTATTTIGANRATTSGQYTFDGQSNVRFVDFGRIEPPLGLASAQYRIAYTLASVSGGATTTQRINGLMVLPDTRTQIVRDSVYLGTASGVATYQFTPSGVVRNAVGLTLGFPASTTYSDVLVGFGALPEVPIGSYAVFVAQVAEGTVANNRRLTAEVRVNERFQFAR